MMCDSSRPLRLVLLGDQTTYEARQRLVQLFAGEQPLRRLFEVGPDCTERLILLDEERVRIHVKNALVCAGELYECNFVKQVEESSGCAVVFDTNDLDSLRSAKEYFDLIKRHAPHSCIVLVGDKTFQYTDCDEKRKDKKAVPYSTAKLYADELSEWLHCRVPYIEVVSKRTHGNNVELAFVTLATLAAKN